MAALVAGPLRPTLFARKAGCRRPLASSRAPAGGFRPGHVRIAAPRGSRGQQRDGRSRLVKETPGGDQSQE